MNILFCGDAGVCRGLFLSALSLAKNTANELDIYILTASVGERKAVSADFAEKLQKTMRSKNKYHRVILLDISDSFNAYLPLANMTTRFTPLCMLRLFADITSELPDKLLYLDTDVLCRADFADLYALDMSGRDVAGVPDRYGKWFFGNVLRHDYLNSGVLLMNLKQIRQNGLFEKCRIRCRDKKMFMPDQSAINKYALKIKIPERYNAQGKIKSDTVFKHFTTFFKFFPYIHAVTVKPWHVEKMHNVLKIYEFDDILEEYERNN